MSGRRLESKTLSPFLLSPFLLFPFLLSPFLLSLFLLYVSLFRFALTTKGVILNVELTEKKGEIKKILKIKPQVLTGSLEMGLN